MSADDFALLSPHLSPCRAGRGAVLFEPDVPFEKVWFLDSGVGSIITMSPEGLTAENGLFGREGFAPVAAIMGSDRSPHKGVIQLPDDCWNLPVTRFQEAVDRSATLRMLLLRFVQTLSTQTAFTALSNAVHQVDERLARWILMCDDRLDGADIPLTHEFMSIMLAVRRPSVTTALHILEGNRLIRAERGCVVVRDRVGLEEFAGDSYGVPEREYERLIGPLR